MKASKQPIESEDRGCTALKHEVNSETSLLRMDQTFGRGQTLIVCVLLAALTFIVFWPVPHCSYVGYDDPEYVTRNPHVLSGLSWANVGWAFVTGHASNWHPLTWLSLMLNVQLFGPGPASQHATNLLLHAVSSVLLFVALSKMTGQSIRSAIVAGLFALHPMHVESLAWVAERKDVLSGLFFMLTLLAYGRYTSGWDGVPDVPRTSRPGHSIEDEVELVPPLRKILASPPYWVCLMVFALGLMSKPMLVTMPFILLLLDYWPLRRFDFQRPDFFRGSKTVSPLPAFWPLLAEKIPFFLLSAASSVVTFLVQKHGGAVESLEHLPLAFRLEHALMGYVAYLQKLFWPAHLSILYLHPGHWPLASVLLAGFVLAAVSALVVWKSRSGPYLVAGWLWFLGMLVPVIGLVQAGDQFIADRYTYLTSIGLFIVVTWGVFDLLTHARLPRAALPLCACGLIPAAFAAHRQAFLWKDTETLFNHCLALNPDNFIAHNILGASLDPDAQFDEAQKHFLEAIRIHPTYADALVNLSVLLANHGNDTQALAYLGTAVELNPGLAPVYGKLALALDTPGRSSHAITWYREAVRLNPDDLQSCNNLAWLLATDANPSERNGLKAVALAEHSCELTGYRQAPLLGTLAAAYAEAGRIADAVATAHKAIALAAESGQTAVAERNRELLIVYQSGKAFHEPAER